MMNYFKSIWCSYFPRTPSIAAESLINNSDSELEIRLEYSWKHVPMYDGYLKNNHKCVAYIEAGNKREAIVLGHDYIHALRGIAFQKLIYLRNSINFLELMPFLANYYTTSCGSGIWTILATFFCVYI